MLKTIPNASQPIRSMISLEQDLTSKTHSLRFSKASGLSGFAQRELMSRIVAAASCVFSLLLLVPKLAAGVWDASVGCINSIKQKQRDLNIFNADRAQFYWYALTLSLSSIIRLPILLINPDAELIKRPLSLQPLKRAPHPALPADLKINHQQIARKHLAKKNPAELDANWNLNEFFGSIRFINLERSKDRLASITQQLSSIGLHAEDYARHAACDGRASLPKEVYNRVNSYNPPHFSQEQLEQRHQGQAGCYMSHYTLIKDIAKRYEDAQKHLVKIQQDPEVTESELDQAKAEVRKYSSVIIFEDDDYFGTIRKEDITCYDRGGTSCYFSDKLTTQGVGTTLRRAMHDLPEDWDMLYFMALSYDRPLKTTSPYLSKLVKAVGLTGYAVNAPMYPVLLRQLSKIDNPKQRFLPVDDEIAELHASHNCYVMSSPILAQPGEGSEINGVDQTDQDKKKYWQSN